MGEYYQWFNVDKCEWLDAEPFDTGAKIVSNIDVGNEYTDAVCTLLNGDWRGDRLVYLGDYRHLDGEANPALAKLEADCGHREYCAYDEAEDIYADVAGRFAVARGKTHYDADSDWPRQIPFEGPMDQGIIHFRYVINDTKKQFYDRSRTPVNYLVARRDGMLVGGITRLDFLPVFLGAGKQGWGEAYLTDGLDGENPDGMWLGDEVRVSHNPPSGEYEDISTKFHVFYKPLINEPDEQILPILESPAFKDAIEKDDSADGSVRLLELMRQILDGA